MIFVGIVTCDRPGFFEKCYSRVTACSAVDLVAVVNDGKQDVEVGDDTVYIKNKKNMGVGKSKNILFREALKRKEVEHIFIIEDDILVENCEVFDEYIRARNITGIQHFMFGYHGPANRGNISGGKPCPRYVIDYKVLKLAINAHSVGAFCYYTRQSLQHTGLIDEEYLNAFDHVDHDYRLAIDGFTTPYWNWPDLANSYEYLSEIECSENNSSIRPRSDWMDNIKKGATLFEKKHGYLPAWQNHVPDTTRDNLTQILKDIKHKNSLPC